MQGCLLGPLYEIFNLHTSQHYRYYYYPCFIGESVETLVQDYPANECLSIFNHWAVQLLQDTYVWEALINRSWKLETHLACIVVFTCWFSCQYLKIRAFHIKMQLFLINLKVWLCQRSVPLGFNLADFAFCSLCGGMHPPVHSMPQSSSLSYPTSRLYASLDSF